MKTRPPLKQLGLSVRKRREALGLTQEDFADRLDMNRAYYWRLEHGRKDIRLSTLTRVCEGLKIPMWQLLKDVESA